MRTHRSGSSASLLGSGHHEYKPAKPISVPSGWLMNHTLQLQPVALSGLNAASGTEFSERSGSALYCVADKAPEATMPFFQQLFAMKPTGPGLTDEELSWLAADVGAGERRSVSQTEHSETSWSTKQPSCSRTRPAEAQAPPR